MRRPSHYLTLSLGLTAPLWVALAHPLILLARMPDLYNPEDAIRTVAMNAGVATLAIVVAKLFLKSIGAATIIGVLASIFWQLWRPLAAIISLPSDMMNQVSATIIGFGLLFVIGWCARRSNPAIVKGIAAIVGVSLAAGMGPPLKDLALDFVRLKQAEGKIVEQPLSLIADAGSPDIYHILLDGYARPDVLSGFFDVDLSAFIQQLESRKFAVLQEATANYPQTVISMNAMLGMEYLDQIVERVPGLKGHSFRKFLSQRLRNATVPKSLIEAGYEILSTPTVYAPIAVSETRAESRPLCAFNLFEIATLGRTPLASFCSVVPDGWDGHLFRTVFRGAISRGPADEGAPVFDFRHILSPHPPFVLDANGDEIQPTPPFSWDLSDASHLTRMQPDRLRLYKYGYAAQVQGLNRKLIGLVDRLLASPRPKIIILHGDHGSGLHLSHENVKDTCLWERLSPLVAVYASDGRLQQALPPDVSLVNIYRVVFNLYFGQSLKLLPNRHFYAPFTSPSEFTEVSPTEMFRACATVGVARHSMSVHETWPSRADRNAVAATTGSRHP